MKYVVVDRRTGERVAGPFATRKRATAKADRLDMEYGACRYSVEPMREEI